MTRSTTALSLCISSIFCFIVGVVMFFQFAHPEGTHSAPASAVSRASPADIPYNVENANRREEPEEAPATETPPPLPPVSLAENVAASPLVQPPWKMRIASSSPYTLSTDELLDALGVPTDKVDDAAYHRLDQSFEEYKLLREEAFAQQQYHIEEALEKLRQEGRYFTTSEREKYNETIANLKNDKGTYTSVMRNTPSGERHFVVWLSEHPHYKDATDDLVDLRRELKYRIYEALVGPVPPQGHRH